MQTGQRLSYIFGVISNILWLIVFIPTLYINYKNKNSDAISFLLLYCLILGDIFSILSASSKNLNLVIIYSALYHIFLDIIIITQVLYYRYYRYYRHNYISLTWEDEHEQQNKYKKHFMYLTNLEFILVSIGIFICIFIKVLLDYQSSYNDIIAWGSTIIFIVARFPQIILNYKRSSTEGLSLSSFIVIMIANTFFLLSILINLYDIPKEMRLNYIVYNIQWIIGCTFTSLLDIFIFYQFILYNNF